MSGFTAHPTQPGNTQELTSAGTLNYDIIRSGSTRRWGTEPQMKSSGNGTNSTEQRKNSKSPCPGTPGLLNGDAHPGGFEDVGRSADQPEVDGDVAGEPDEVAGDAGGVRDARAGALRSGVPAGAGVAGFDVDVVGQPGAVETDEVLAGVVGAAAAGAPVGGFTAGAETPAPHVQAAEFGEPGGDAGGHPRGGRRDDLPSGGGVDERVVGDGDLDAVGQDRRRTRRRGAPGR